MLFHNLEAEVAEMHVCMLIVLHKTEVVIQPAVIGLKSLDPKCKQEPGSERHQYQLEVLTITATNEMSEMRRCEFVS